MDDIDFQELRQQKSIQSAAELAVEKVCNTKLNNCNIISLCLIVVNTTRHRLIL